MMQSQGIINGRITKLANDPDKLKLFMADKTPEQIEQGRIHLKMINWLRRKHEQVQTGGKGRRKSGRNSR